VGSAFGNGNCIGEERRKRVMKKVLSIVGCLLFTLFLANVCLAEGGGGGDPAPKDPSCQSIVIEK
jgi:hypothetical protein